MTGTAGRPVGNPFSTRHVRPGALPALDSRGRPRDVAALLARLDAVGGSAALVGTHGSGKTTLLLHLAAALEAGGRRVERVRLRTVADWAPLAGAAWRCARGGTVCIDSWERLGRLPALLVAWAARRVGARLLVTAHRPGPLPTLLECATSPALVTALVARLPRGDAALVPGAADVDAVFRAAAGNVREALFLLYDRHEVRRRGPAAPAAGVRS
ncbi:MAG: hypothetical protein EBZ74_02720 [Planctomycetia bacterium]|nr:hypothetical protein [Planctomycetia bacterium]